MSTLLRIVGTLPIPTSLKLEWQRELLETIYARELELARKTKNWEKARAIENEHRFEIDLNTEEQDLYITKQIVRRAKKMRLPIPSRYNSDKTESDHWYEGHHTRRWALTNRGVSAIREEIRREIKARHEVRVLWVTWLSALTGVIGAVTGLVAILGHKAL
jgi:hypothetical protein